MQNCEILVKLFSYADFIYFLVKMKVIISCTYKNEKKIILTSLSSNPASNGLDVRCDYRLLLVISEAVEGEE
jgi:hypothetical protein